MVEEHPLVLRADIVSPPSKTPIATNTLSLSEERVWVASDSLDGPKNEVLLQLSFPGLLAPISLRAVVDEIRDAAGLGVARSVALRFVFGNDDERRAIATLCAPVPD